MSVPQVDKGWHEGWESGNTPFHYPEVHPILQRHLDWLLNGQKSARIFFPFCGKSLDMKWLYDKGHVIVGVEGVELPVKDFFEESKIEYNIAQKGAFKSYASKDGRIEIFFGNYYDMTPEQGSFDAVWDRGAMEAVEREEWVPYTEKMKVLVKLEARLLVEVAIRDDNKGAPHMIPIDKIAELYGDKYSVKEVDRFFPFPKESTGFLGGVLKGFTHYSVERVAK